jgi:hypothetical protein
MSLLQGACTCRRGLGSSQHNVGQMIVINVSRASETSAMKSLSSFAYLRIVCSSTSTAGRKPSLPSAVIHASLHPDGPPAPGARSAGTYTRLLFQLNVSTVCEIAWLASTYRRQKRSGSG